MRATSAAEPAPLSVIVLAAGAGRRMHSARPKPLHRLCGRPLVRHVLDAVCGLPDHGVACDRVVVVVGADASALSRELHDVKGVTDVVEQGEPRGTADAVLVGLTAFADELDDADVLVVPADVPLVRTPTLAELVAGHRASGAAATILAARVDDPAGRLRVVREGSDAKVVQVVEHRALIGDEHRIDEVATGVWCFRRSVLAPALRRVDADGLVGEANLAGVVGVLARTGHPVEVVHTDAADEVRGINDRADLARAEKEMRRRINRAWLEAGVTLVDPDVTYVDATVELAPDVTVFPGAVLQGATVVGAGTEIGPGCRLVDTEVGAGCRLESTTAVRARIGRDCVVGPHAVLGPGSVLAAATVTGPFYAAGDDPSPSR